MRQAHAAVDRYQLVNSYGLFRRMTGVGGRPEVVIEGSYDGVTWTVRLSGHFIVTVAQVVHRGASEVNCLSLFFFYFF